MKIFNLAIQDLISAAKQYRVCFHLGWTEVKQRYRRSVIGPWWITISMFIFILMMGVVFSRIFHQNIEEYLLFFTSGYLFWSYISSSISEATEIFRSNSGYIKQIRLPYNLYIYKHLVRQTIILLHNFVVYFFICAFFLVPMKAITALVIPGFLLLSLNMYWICFLIALISTRFMDMVPVINSCVQIAFFVTPISWMPKLLSSSSVILKLNPLVYLIDLVRSPLLGTAPSMESWIVGFSMAIIGCLISFMIFAIVRLRIVFWID